MSSWYSGETEWRTITAGTGQGPGAPISLTLILILTLTLELPSALTLTLEFPSALTLTLELPSAQPSPAYEHHFIVSALGQQFSSSLSAHRSISKCQGFPRLREPCGRPACLADSRGLSGVSELTA